VKPKSRALAAFLALVAVLFAQLATAAYACPGMEIMDRSVISQQEVPPCHEPAPAEEPNALCKAHCQQGDQALGERGASVPAVAFMALPSSFAPVAFHDATLRSGAQSSLFERPTGPPLAVRHCRFLI
jgi:hypothetical protein